MRSRLNGVSVSFDLDGTLVDTARDLVRVLNEVVTKQGLKEVNYEDSRDLIGFGSLAMVRAAYAAQNEFLTELKGRTLQAEFFSVYEKSLSQDSVPYEGVEDALVNLKRKGARLSVCTNKPGRYARPLLADLGLSKYFDRIVGPEDTKANKPSPTHLFDAVGHRGTRPIIMVGDGAPDVFAARAAKVPVILMRSGYNIVPIDHFGADRVLRTFRELPATCEELL